MGKEPLYPGSICAGSPRDPVRGGAARIRRPYAAFVGGGRKDVTTLSAFAQFERSLIRERQREGIALAKGAVCKGRKPALNAERIAQLREEAATGANRSKLAKEFGISRETLYQYIRCIFLGMFKTQHVSCPRISKINNGSESISLFRSLVERSTGVI